VTIAHSMTPTGKNAECGRLQKTLGGFAKTRAVGTTIREKVPAVRARLKASENCESGLQRFL